MAEPPYPLIARYLKAGEVVPFLGAGVNFGHRQPPGARWEGVETKFLPSGAELSHYLATECNFPSEDEHDLTDLAKVSSYFVESSARRRLRENLHELFAVEFPPCAIHAVLAGVAKVKPLLIVTTNYDDLTERALAAAGVAYDLVAHATDRKDAEASVLWWKAGAAEPSIVPPNKLYIDLEQITVVYKMHGTVFRPDPKWDSYVITEDDYVDFLSRMTGQSAIPALFMHRFRTRHFLFLGYGLRDWNLRVVLRNLRTAIPGAAPGDEDGDDELRSWAIQYRPSELERELWDSRHVKIYDVDINRFADLLQQQVER